MIYRDFLSPVGEIVLGCTDGPDARMVLVEWRSSAKLPTVMRRIERGTGDVFAERDHPLLDAAQQQISEYFDGRRKDFDLPYLAVGTHFQQLVWSELEKVPYGYTTTYGDIAMRIGKPSAVRAVANAVGANALSLIIPCHRIIGSNGTLTGFAGGLSAKATLLALESHCSL